ncbi:MAG: GNAT family N-acetyltransferase [Verrucomicrobia bacterium]|nr:GNAT family N-acetyltransferase [Verrucomicrobiota bacterium]
MPVAARCQPLSLEVHPLTPERWTDLEELFGARGACAGCWCMWWRRPAAIWQKHRGAGNRRALRTVTQRGPPPGLLAYAEGAAVGWCAVAPRAAYVRLATSRTLQPVDAEPVWSVPCFFVRKDYRGRGLVKALLDAAVAFAGRQGAPIVEGYPVEPAGRQADAFVYTGLASAFRKAGFVEVARRSPTRPIMRRRLTGAAA